MTFILHIVRRYTLSQPWHQFIDMGQAKLVEIARIARFVSTQDGVYRVRIRLKDGTTHPPFHEYRGSYVGGRYVAREEDVMYIAKRYNFTIDADKLRRMPDRDLMHIFCTQHRFAPKSKTMAMISNELEIRGYTADYAEIYHRLY